MIQIIPAIDIINGQCVRLQQGDYGNQTTYNVSPVEMVARYREAGVRRVHLVDLDGARQGHPCNLRTLQQIARQAEGMEIEWGGGLKISAHLEQAFGAGATQVVLGSVAAKEPERFEGWLKEYGPDHVVLGADIDGEGRIAIKGWTESVPLTIANLVERYMPYGLSQAIVTDITRDGMLQGPNMGLYEQLQTAYPEVNFTVSGGISGIHDIEQLSKKGLRRVIIGKAIYENRITLKQLQPWLQNA